MICNSCGEVEEKIELNIASSIEATEFIEELFAHKIFKKNGYRFNFIDLNSSQAKKALETGIVDFYISDKEFENIKSNSFKEKLIAKDALLLIAHSNNPIHNFNKLENLEDIETFNELESLNIFIEENQEELALIRASKYQDQAKQKLVYINDIAPIQSNFNFGNYPLIKKIRLYYQSQIIRTKNKCRGCKKLIALLNSDQVHIIIKSMGLLNLNSNELLLEELAEEPIRIGVGVPLKNQYAKAGKAVLASAKLVAEEYKLDGAIQGRKIEIHVCDDEANITDALKAIDCARKFVKLGTKAVIGHLGSEASIATSGIYQENNIVQISPTAVHPGFTHQENNRGLLFRTVPVDHLYPETITQLLSKLATKDSRTLVIHNGNLYGQNIISHLVSHARKSDISNSIVIEELKSQNWDSKIDQSKFSNIVLIGPEYELENIALTIDKSRNSNLNLIALWNTVSPFNTKHKFSGLTNTEIFIVALDIDMNNPEFQNFKTKFLALKDYDFNFAAVLSFISSKVLLSSLEKYYEGSYSSISESLHSETFEVFGREFKFDEYGDVESFKLGTYHYVDGSFSKMRLNK